MRRGDGERSEPRPREWAIVEHTSNVGMRRCDKTASGLAQSDAPVCFRLLRSGLEYSGFVNRILHVSDLGRFATCSEGGNWIPPSEPVGR